MKWKWSSPITSIVEVPQVSDLEDLVDMLCQGAAPAVDNCIYIYGLHLLVHRARQSGDALNVDKNFFFLICWEIGLVLVSMEV